jgi:hypothetical protein
MTMIFFLSCPSIAVDDVNLEMLIVYFACCLSSILNLGICEVPVDLMRFACCLSNNVRT